MDDFCACGDVVDYNHINNGKFSIDQSSFVEPCEVVANRIIELRAMSRELIAHG